MLILTIFGELCKGETLEVCTKYNVKCSFACMLYITLHTLYALHVCATCILTCTHTLHICHKCSTVQESRDGSYLYCTLQHEHWFLPIGHSVRQCPMFRYFVSTIGPNRIHLWVLDLRHVLRSVWLVALRKLKCLTVHVYSCLFHFYMFSQ